MVTPSGEAAQTPASATSKWGLGREAQAALLRVRTGSTTLCSFSFQNLMQDGCSTVFVDLQLKAYSRRRVLRITGRQSWFTKPRLRKEMIHILRVWNSIQQNSIVHPGWASVGSRDAQMKSSWVCGWGEHISRVLFLKEISWNLKCEVQSYWIHWQPDVLKSETLFPLGGFKAERRKSPPVAPPSARFQL